MAGLAEGVVDFALHCMAWQDGIPGFGFECGVIERGLELLLEEKGLVDSRLKKNGQRLMLKYLSLDSYRLIYDTRLAVSLA